MGGQKYSTFPGSIGVSLHSAIREERLSLIELSRDMGPGPLGLGLRHFNTRQAARELLHRSGTLNSPYRCSFLLRQGAIRERKHLTSVIDSACRAFQHLGRITGTSPSTRHSGQWTVEQKPV